MNVHPFIVHFPIALLTLYSLFEFFPLERWYPRVVWQDIKAILVCFGGVGLLTALITGQLAESSLIARASGNILHLHKLFAGASTAIFGLVALAYFIQWVFNKHTDLSRTLKRNFPLIGAYSKFMLKRWVVMLFAFAGFVALSITGALGVMIIYGPNGDFITQFIYQLFKPLLR